jgi:hypothetical protein
LHFDLPSPLPGLAIGTGDGQSRLVLSEPPPRYANGVPPGVSTVRLSRAKLLEGLDQQADMAFSNMAITVVDERFSHWNPPVSGLFAAIEARAANPKKRGSYKKRTTA